MLELMVTLVIASLPFTLSVPAFNGIVNRGRVARAIGGIAAFDIEVVRASNGAFIGLGEDY